MVSIVLRRAALERLAGRMNDAQLNEWLPRVKAGVESLTPDEVGVEVTGDRPDLLSAAGLARALKGMRGEARGLPALKLSDSGAEFLVDASVAKVRPYGLAAFAELARPLAEEDLVELMQLQEKLVLTHGRRRRKVAIGIHDAAKLQPPFVYKAVEPASVSFVPLGSKERMNLEQILERHEKGREYGFTLAGAKHFPVILDADGTVASFPPIINNSLTNLVPGTTRLFLDVTGTDREACNVALNILCHDLADAGAKVSSARVKGPEGEMASPATEPEKMIIGAAEASKALGVPLTPKQVVEALERCRLGAHAEGDFVRVSLPRYRADFLHPVDLVEEVALGLGFDSFAAQTPQSFTGGARSAKTSLVGRAAGVLVGLGFLEHSGYVLTSRERLELAREPARPLELKNPVSTEYALLRPSLLPGLLDVLARNKHADYPQRLFEVGDVAVRDDAREVRARTELRAAVVTAHANASLTEAASALHELLKAVGGWDRYRLEPSKEALFLEGRRALVRVEKAERGRVGEVHPEVLEQLGLTVPVAAFELTLSSD
jgi:phenylalanyl-tRNA synthetase beta chain